MSAAPSSSAPSPTRSPDPDVLATVRPPKRRRRWLVLLGLAGALGLAGVLYATSGSDEVVWETDEATVGDVVQHVTAVGTLSAVDLVEVGSDQSGVVASVLVDVNDPVTAGQVLATLDLEPFDADVSSGEAQVQSAQASLAQARVTLRQAEATLVRTTALFERDATTAATLETDQLAVESGQAQVQSAQASLAQARASLSKARQSREDAVIVSPIDGFVLSRNIEPGQTVVSTMSATTLFSVAADLASMEVEVAVDEADVSLVVAGDHATFTVPAWPDRVFDAEVVRVDLAPTDDTVVTYPALLRLDNSDGALRPGMTATASIEVARWDDHVRVSSAALRYEPGDADPDDSHVYVLNDGVAMVQPVEVLGSDGAWTAVRGLDSGAAVVVGGGR